MKFKNLQLGLVVFGLALYGWLFREYIIDYYSSYPVRSADQWQYGIKQVVEYTKENNGYFQIFMTDVRSQPYIFFLYFLKTPLPSFLQTVEYNLSESRSYNLVSLFSKYHFGDWDPLESIPNPGVLYIVSASQYDGLRHKDIFNVKKRVRYPDGRDAFFLVSYP